MTIWDDRILEHIRKDKGGRVGELTDKENIKVTNTHISRRCKKLADYGLLRDLGNGVYVITEEGKAYLDGKYDAESGAYVDVVADDEPSASNTE